MLFATLDRRCAACGLPEWPELSTQANTVGLLSLGPARPRAGRLADPSREPRGWRRPGRGSFRGISILAPCANISLHAESESQAQNVRDILEDEWNTSIRACPQRQNTRSFEVWNKLCTSLMTNRARTPCAGTVRADRDDRRACHLCCHHWAREGRLD